MRRYISALAILVLAWPALADELKPGEYFTATDNASSAIMLSDTGLKEAGLAAGDVFPQSDEIRIFESKDKMNESPKARIWLNAKEGGGYWFHTGGVGSAADLEIKTGEAVVIYTRVSRNSVTWTNVFTAHE